MANRVLMIAFHFPPVAGSSGVQRTLKFSQYLPENGWECTILTVNPKAYERVDEGQLQDIRKDMAVVRAFSFDTSRHLRIMGSYPKFLALPDRWVSWLISAIPVGLWTIFKFKPAVLWCTYPIASAHVIGWLLSKVSGIPLVADFRDSMTDVDYPKDEDQRRVFSWIEAKVIRHASRCVFTTPGARRLYRERYPDVPEERMVVIENAFDEENFLTAEAGLRDRAASGDSQKQPFRLLHSGIVYPHERDPTALFAAIKRAKDSGDLDAASFQLVLRASGHVEQYSQALVALRIDDLVELAPPIPYVEALEEILQASGLLLLQAANCNNEIPAKVYEYFRAGRPILALTDERGDTAAVLRANHVPNVCALDDVDAIYAGLLRFIDDVNSGALHGPDANVVAQNTRFARTVQLAEVLNQIGEHQRN
jgi:hypothetical protein